jgi:NAD(P)-dependent dehydrogenase (short-subunit alcohol dehydrogenase family)
MSTLKELGDLRGRRALITGACGNLGKVIAETLAELGADLVLIDRKGSNFDAISRNLLERWGVVVQTQFCDLEQEEQRVTLIANLIAESGKSIDILVNNAAFVGGADLEGWSLPFELQTVDTWRRALEVNLTAAFQLCQGLTPMLKKSDGPSIINIASIYGVYGPDWRLYEGTNMGNPAAYAASKAGLIQLTRWMATTIAPTIRVNAISPGGISRNQPREFTEKYELRTPLARMATEDDFRGAIAFLATDLSRYVTGQNLIIDGGWGIW